MHGDLWSNGMGRCFSTTIFLQIRYWTGIRLIQEVERTPCKAHGLGFLYRWDE